MSELWEDPRYGTTKESLDLGKLWAFIAIVMIVSALFLPFYLVNNARDSQKFYPGDRVEMRDNRTGQIIDTWSTFADHWYTVRFQNNGVEYTERVVQSRLGRKD